MLELDGGDKHTATTNAPKPLVRVKRICTKKKEREENRERRVSWVVIDMHSTYPERSHLLVLL